jgi:uncharacterized protein YbaP (TraB family)
VNPVALLHVGITALAKSARSFLCPLLALLLIVMPSVLLADDWYWTAPAYGKNRYGKLFMWKATGPSGTAYLLGSIHMVRPDIYPLPEEIENDFRASDRLVVEINALNVDPHYLREVRKRGHYSSGDALENHISKQTKAAFDDFMHTAGSAAPAYGLSAW